MVSGSVYGQTGPLAQEWGVDGTGGALSGRTYPDRLCRWRSGDSRRRALWRRDRALRDGRLHGRRPAGAAAKRARVPCRRFDVRDLRPADAPLSRARRKAGKRPRRTAMPIRRSAPGHLPAARRGPLGGDQPGRQGERARFRCMTGRRYCAWTRAREDHAIVAELQALGLGGGRGAGLRRHDRARSAARRARALVTLDHPLLGPFGHIATPMLFAALLRVPGSAYARRTRSRFRQPPSATCTPKATR